VNFRVNAIRREFGRRVCLRLSYIRLLLIGLLLQP